MGMKKKLTGLLMGSAFLLFPSMAHAIIVTNDTWLDGERNSPAAPAYSEFGVDSDLDGDIESAWFQGGSGTLDPIAPGGPLRSTQTTSSQTMTTYFTPEGSELTLANAGDRLRVTWQFEVSGQLIDNTQQGLRVALVDSPGGSRISTENSPGADQYTGYSVFLNINSILSRDDPFELHERANPALFENLLSSSSAWTSLAEDGTQSNTGYLPGIDYTFMMTLTRTALDGLDILTSISGDSLDNDGSMSISYLDPSPNGGSFSFDTFVIRPDGYDRSYEIFDTSLFKIEFNEPGAAPEPCTFALVGLGLAGLGFAHRKRRFGK
jgi:hypothetical protein